MARIDHIEEYCRWLSVEFPNYDTTGATRTSSAIVSLPFQPSPGGGLVCPELVECEVRWPPLWLSGWDGETGAIQNRIVDRISITARADGRQADDDAPDLGFDPSSLQQVFADGSVIDVFERQYVMLSKCTATTDFLNKSLPTVVQAEGITRHKFGTGNRGVIVPAQRLVIDFTTQCDSTSLIVHETGSPATTGNTMLNAVPSIRMWYRLRTLSPWQTQFVINKYKNYEQQPATRANGVARDFPSVPSN